MALYRALESSERAPLFRDPFAPLFLSPFTERALRIAQVRALRPWLERYADYRAPGARTSAIARTCFIDDVVRRAVARGVEQFVILGAGYDCRAHRMPELRGLHVFELDRADTQNLKRDRLRAQPNVRAIHYVAVDFGVDDFIERLTASSWKAQSPSLFIWEGVTNYLDEASVAKVLRAIGQCQARTTVVFTYIHRGVIDGTVSFDGADKLVRNVKAMREPWRFGIDPSEIGAFLARFGLALEEDLGADEYRRRYLGRKALRGYAFYRIAVAHT